MLTEKTGIQAVLTYSYDKNGNMLTKSDQTVQVFDQLNQMSSYKKGSAAATTYTYFPDNMRKSKKVGTATAIEHVWLNDEIVLELNGSTVISSYIHGEALIVSAYGWYLYNSHGDDCVIIGTSWRKPVKSRVCTDLAPIFLYEG